MKVLIFSHDSDIDGVGSVVLAKLAFKDVDYVLCDVTTLPLKIEEFYKNGKIYEYNKIYITDLWLTNKVLSKVAGDRKLNGKIHLFDHHKSAVEMGLDRYPFTQIKSADKFGKCAGISLFYEHLMQNKFLPKVKGIYEFVELTRRYDTWEWSTRYQDINAYYLNLLWEVLGNLEYINRITTRLKDDNTNFNLTSEEQLLVELKEKEYDEKISEYAKSIIIREIDGYKVGIFFVKRKYCNMLSEYLRKNNFNIDYMVDISFDSGYVYYRSIDYSVNVRLITEKLSGTGQDSAASIVLDDDNYQDILKHFFN